MKKLFKRQNLPVYSIMSAPRRNKYKADRHGRLNTIQKRKHAAFSLVEMLMALLVASLLLAALAPVITRKVDESVTINGNMNPAGTKQHVVEIEYGSQECSDIKTDADGSTYCEGEFTIPGGYNGYLQVTVIGAGGGGGTAPTAGYTEYTNEGSTNTFTVPAMTGDIEATLVSGGGGGETDTVVKTHTFVTYNNGTFIEDSKNGVTVDKDGTGTWTIPVNSRGKDMVATACGGGGGGGCSGGTQYYPFTTNGYGGGSGGYVQNQVINFGNASSFTYYIGGGGASGTLMASNSSLSIWEQIGGDEPKPYGGGGSYHSSYITGGGVGGDSSHDATAGKYITSNAAGGAGGIGNPYGRQNTCMCDLSPNPNKVIYLKGGDGGQPGGGGGAFCHYCNCMSSGGGGGGAASQLVANSTIILNAPGGGGGGGAVRPTNLRSDNNDCCLAGEAGAGGGGGGTGGGAGGGVNSRAGKGGTGGRDGSEYTGGILSGNIFGSNYCDGGDGGVYTGFRLGRGGKSGAIKLSYIDYDITRGKGGNAGNIILNRKINTNPNEALKLEIGNGGAGSAAAYVNKSGNNGTVVSRIEAGSGGATTLKRNTSVLINTGTSAANSSADKNGGSLSIFNNEISCNGGSGGTQNSPNATAPTSGYGCGGGAGYMEGNGSRGGGGYARIAWNKYWDEAVNAYKMTEIGAGGGGAAGNALTHSIPVKSNQTIKFRIGKGGDGAYVINNVLVNSKKGGDTVFENIKAGGGKGGESTGYNSVLNILANGKGGSISDICHFGDVNYINNNKKCRKSTSGGNAENSNGGKGANFAGYSYTLTGEDGNSEKKEIKGTGGGGGIQDTGENSNGKNAEGTGSGGGGASIRDLGKVNSSSQSNIVNNPTKGGNGGNGKIILEWWQ